MQTNNDKPFPLQRFLFSMLQSRISAKTKTKPKKILKSHINRFFIYIELFDKKKWDEKFSMSYDASSAVKFLFVFVTVRLLSISYVCKFH